MGPLGVAMIRVAMIRVAMMIPLFGEPFGAHAVVEHLIGQAGRLPAHRLGCDALCSAQLPVSAERRVDVGVDACSLASAALACALQSRNSREIV